MFIPPRVRRHARRFLVFFIVLSIIILNLPSGDVQHGETTESGTRRVSNSILRPGYSDLFGNLSLYQNPFGARNRGRPIVDDDKDVVEIVPDEIDDDEMVSVLRQHNYRDDGLLEVSEGGIHPIYELIARGEKEWKRKLDNASRTLEEAVKEYTRRYNRRPPKGFDHWWDYVQKHNIQLPDQYDQIFHDIEPFWGVDPIDLAKIHRESEIRVDTYTIGKNASSPLVEVLTWAFREGEYDKLIAGSRPLIDMLNKVAEHLPPFRMTISPHDAPNRMSDYKINAAVLAAAAKKTTIKTNQLPRIHRLGWLSACSPKSAARRQPLDLDNPPPPIQDQKTFIYDHVLSMDPCNHPQLLHYHGLFLSHDKGPAPQHHVVPEFAPCSSVLHHNVRLPMPYLWVEDIYPQSDNPDWEDRVDERLMWRGKNTGIWHTERTRWHNSHRDFLMRSTNEVNGTVRVLPPDVMEGEKMGAEREYKKSLVNPLMMDVAFGGDVSSCEGETCKLLKALYPYREMQSMKQAGQYKYVIDVDGNGWSGRFKRLMTTKALVFKTTVYPEWYADRIVPWVHYVPIQVDFSDLYDALFFFRGDENGQGAHDDLARKIALAGREWSKTYWRKEDLVAYFFRLTLEYARVMSPDRDAMTY